MSPTQRPRPGNLTLRMRTHGGPQLLPQLWFIVSHHAFSALWAIRVCAPLRLVRNPQPRIYPKPNLDIVQTLPSIIAVPAPTSLPPIVPFPILSLLNADANTSAAATSVLTPLGQRWTTGALKA